jgi:hypothetical protein
MVYYSRLIYLRILALSPHCVAARDYEYACYGRNAIAASQANSTTTIEGTLENVSSHYEVLRQHSEHVRCY